MKQTALILLALAMPVLGQFIPDEASRTTRPLQAPGPNRKATMEIRELLVQGWNQQGKQIQGNLLILFDAETGYFLWHYGECPFNPARVYLADSLTWAARSYATDKSLVFVEAWQPGLHIWESSEKASSMEDAEQQALRTMKAQAHLIPRNGLWWSSPQKVVALLDLGMEFYIPPGYAAPRRAVRVVSIVPTAGGTEVTIEGEWQEKVLLSPAYEVLKATRVDQ